MSVCSAVARGRQSEHPGGKEGQGEPDVGIDPCVVMCGRDRLLEVHGCCELTPADGDPPAGLVRNDLVRLTLCNEGWCAWSRFPKALRLKQRTEVTDQMVGDGATVLCQAPGGNAAAGRPARVRTGLLPAPRDPGRLC